MSQFTPEDFCANIERYKVTVISVVPPMLIVLANHPGKDKPNQSLQNHIASKLTALFHDIVVEKYNLKSLEVLISAAAPLGKDLILAASARLKKQGVHVQITQGENLCFFFFFFFWRIKVLIAWGLTETSPACAILKAEEWLTRAGSIGALLSNMEARIVLEDGSDAAVGEEGEMWFRGPNLMKVWFPQER